MTTTLWLNDPVDWGGLEVHPPPWPPNLGPFPGLLTPGSQQGYSGGGGLGVAGQPWALPGLRPPRPPKAPSARAKQPRSPRPPAAPRTQGAVRRGTRLDIRRPSVTTRGPRALLPVLQTASAPPYPDPPAEWVMKPLTEWIVYWVLTRIEGLVEGIDFFYQSPAFGGRNRGPGGVVVDFFLPEWGIAINPLGEHWHYGSSAQQANDLLEAAMLAAIGTQYIFIDAETLYAQPIAVVQAALRGEDWSEMGGRF